jgi:hypothetical protein
MRLVMFIGVGRGTDFREQSRRRDALISRNRDWEGIVCIFVQYIGEARLGGKHHSLT